MKSVIIGTAGHIDHGKTALVKALTGIDADRLEEEKRRGITIDLGFAHLELPSLSGDPLRLGFVDVPGHERFVRNMLAGVGGIDIVMLVIAADESIKPQTREHFDITRLLHVRRGITVLTKSDQVDADTLSVVRMEVEDFVRGSFLEGAPIVAVSSLTGAGLEQLRSELARVAAEVPARSSASLTRLPIDRVFSMKGFGAVVTGTLLSGSIGKEDELEVFPAQQRLRVRGVQVHGEKEERATAGQRTALNLAGVELASLERGMMLASPGVFRSTSTLDVSLSLLPGVRPLKDRARAHFHSYTGETIAEVRLLQGSQLAAGATGYAQLRLAAPMQLLPGDRFILRQFSPVVTIGGGVILDAHPLKPSRNRKQGFESRLAFLQTLGSSDPPAILLARVSRRGAGGLTLAEAIAETGWRPEDVERAAAALSSQIVRTQERDQEKVRLLAASALSGLESATLAAVADFHQRNPLVGGISREELRERLAVSAGVLQLALASLVRARKLEIAGEQVRAAGRGVTMKDEESAAMQRIEQAFASAGLKVPLLKEVLASLPIDHARAQKIVTLLLREKVLVKLSDELVFHRTALEALRQTMLQYRKRAASSPARIDVPAFKELIGVTRKHAIPLLEYLDREHVTRRVGDERIILIE
jgi:selenocysteine-specific elongation factor